jgi:UDP-N-acetylglucosamine diphosphorylase / glucose-1-phosphate thymidylyltransferase / UDP-N-acetylgalactosamine diphosphorylase / glucosamine-1-phosphate N-acetyltransferase / galactosamine-1-phosphate N-acetyltransferase
MNSLSLVDGPFSDDFFPFSLTRSVADIRCGILTIREKWNIYLKNEPGVPGGLSIPSNIIPDPALIGSLSENDPENYFQQSGRLLNIVDILRYNDREIKNDFVLITKDRSSQPISPTNKLTGSDIFLETGAVVEHCYLNTGDGPIYIGKDSLLMEGSMIRGPFAIGEKGVVKMGTKIYGATSAGPYCVLGGEIKNSVIFGYSSKAHDGYLGDSVMGEWCNLGAGSSNSNIKNTGGSIKLWNPLNKSFVDGGLKCGLMMGDYSRSAINTSFSSGTVIGTCCHVFGNGPTPPYLPPFSWGSGANVYAFEKAMQHINKWKKLKGMKLSQEEIKQLKNIFDMEKQFK